MGTTNRMAGNKMKGTRAVGHQNHTSKNHPPHPLGPGASSAKQPDISHLLSKKDKH